MDPDGSTGSQIYHLDQAYIEFPDVVIELDDAKVANILIEDGLVLDHTLYECMRYNPAYRIKQCFNCYEFGHVLVHCQKSTKCGVLRSGIFQGLIEELQE